MTETHRLRHNVFHFCSNKQIVGRVAQSV